MACCQANSFANESKNSPNAVSSSFNESDEKYIPPDFMNNKTWLDFVKVNLI